MSGRANLWINGHQIQKDYGTDCLSYGHYFCRGWKIFWYGSQMSSPFTQLIEKTFYTYQHWALMVEDTLHERWVEWYRIFTGRYYASMPSIFGKVGILKAREHDTTTNSYKNYTYLIAARSINMFKISEPPDECTSAEWLAGGLMLTIQNEYGMKISDLIENKKAYSRLKEEIKEDIMILEEEVNECAEVLETMFEHTSTERP